MRFLSVWQNYCVPVLPFTPFFKDTNVVIAKKRSMANLGHLFNHASILNFEEMQDILIYSYYAIKF